MTELDKTTLERINRLCAAVKQGRGGLTFFAAIFRPDIYKKEKLERWDLVISAAWVKEKNRRKDYEYVFEKIIETFKSRSELEVFLSKVVLINETDRFIKAFTKAVGTVDKETKPVNGFPVASKNLKINIHKAYIFFSNNKEKKATARKKS